MVFSRFDWRLYLFLLNVKRHLDADYDFVLVIVGDTGTGKSMFALHLLETWYKFILCREVKDKFLSENIHSNYHGWLKRFKDLSELDCNVYDEGSTALDSKEHAARLSRDLTKMFNVFRSKRFFTVIVLPNFFNLNKYFRESRIRGLVHVHKRGSYRLFSKLGVGFLNVFNDRRNLKSMFVARPLHSGHFGDFKGRLRGLYEKQKLVSVDGLIDSVIKDHDPELLRGVDSVDLFAKDVKRLRECNPPKSYEDIRKELGVSKGLVFKIVKKLKDSGELV